MKVYKRAIVPKVCWFCSKVITPFQRFRWYQMPGLGFKAQCQVCGDNKREGK